MSMILEEVVDDSGERTRCICVKQMNVKGKEELKELSRRAYQKIADEECEADESFIIAYVKQKKKGTKNKKGEGSSCSSASKNSKTSKTSKKAKTEKVGS